MMKIDFVMVKTAVKNHLRVFFLLLFFTLVVVSAAVYIPSVVASRTAAGIVNKELPIYSVDTKEKKVALSFDAAWGNEDTQTLLDIMAKYNVQATFFMTGGWIESYPEDVKKIAEAGHDLGNHSENHKQMSKLTKEQCEDEILEPHKRVEELTGVEMCLFRPPYGDYNDTLITVVDKCGYYPIQWTVDSLDWKDYGADDIVSRVLNHKNLTNGAIILMHNGAKYTKDALERVIVGLQKQGYEIVPVSELIYAKDYTIDHTGKQIQK